MSNLVTNAPTLASCQQYQALLAVTEAIVAHRDLNALIHDLAGRLREVVRFDALCLIRHDAENNLMHRHVFDFTEPLPAEAPAAFTVEDDPGGQVLQTQQPLIFSTLAEAARWPRYVEKIAPLGPNNVCILPLTTARKRLGTLVFASKQEGAYDDADLDFLGRVAKQVAIAFENALAFECIENLKEKLETEKVYLEEEIRTDNNFDDIIGESVVLRRVLKEVETVASTESTVLIHGETGTGKELQSPIINDERSSNEECPSTP
jgi:formate hydrogenlyase transcriptional activator